MAKEEIAKKSKARLSNPMHVSFYEAVEECFTKIAVPESINKLYSDFKASYEIEVDSWLMVKASEQTPLLDKYNGICVKRYRIIATTVRGCLTSDDADEAAAASSLKAIFSGIKITGHNKRDENSGLFAKLLRELSQPERESALKVLGVDRHFNVIKEAHAKVVEANTDRAYEKEHVAAIPMTVARANTDDCFWEMAKALNGDAAKEADDNGNCSVLIRTINTAIKTWHTSEKRKKADTNAANTAATNDKGKTNGDKAKDNANDKGKANGDNSKANADDKEGKTVLEPEKDNKEEQPKQQEQPKSNEPTQGEGNQSANASQQETPDSGGTNGSGEGATPLKPAQ